MSEFNASVREDLFMNKLSEASEIWPPALIQDSDIEEAIKYATVSLPWTFDRMRYGPRSQRAVNNRLINILSGVLNQNILERILTEKGVECSKDWKNYRESDVFDFRIEGEIYDVKTVKVYSEYSSAVQREPFSVELLISNRDYEGPEWKHFFPMMVPISQLTYEKLKDSYIFGIAESHEDIRKRIPFESDEGFWCAAPIREAHSFFHSTPVIYLREKNEKGFNVKIHWNQRQMSLSEDEKRMEITLFGEWSGNRQEEVIELNPDETVLSGNEFSSLSCVKLEHPSSLLANDQIVISVENNFPEYVPKSTNPKINLNESDFEWILVKDSFVNLRIPNDYKVYWVGHITFREFSSIFPKYNSYFIPHPKNMEINVPGKATTRIRDRFASMDRRRNKAIESGIDIPWPELQGLIGINNVINAGLLIAARSFSRNLGAACYYYPPFGFYETALYVLPCDLYTMESLVTE